MQEKDITSVEYFEDPQRFADLLNGHLFGGNQIVKAENVQERNRVLTRTKQGGQRSESSTVIRDVLKQVGIGANMRVMLISLEEQSDIHYAMPLRVMNGDAVVYQRQWRKKRKRHWKKKNLKSAEYISGFAKTDKLIPTLTLVLYFGSKPWDGPRTLKEMMDLSEIPESIRDKIADYPMELLEIRNCPNPERFQTDLQFVVGFLKYASDKEALAAYVTEHKEEFADLAEDAYDLISCMSKSRELKEVKAIYKNEEGGTVNMCQAITEMIEDGRKEGWKEGERAGKRKGWKNGKREGRKEGEFLFMRLTQILLKDGHVEILEKAMEDEAYRNQLYKKYKLRGSIK